MDSSYLGRLNGKPLVSIGLPVFNGAKFIRSALDSLLEQTFENFELVISDNCSTDETEVICRAYAAQDKRIRYHRHKENRGAIWNFNHVFELSTGTYFKWAASDDICSPTFLERCVDVLNNDKSITWCHTQSAKTDENGRLLSTYPVLCNNPALPTHSTREGLPRNCFQSSRPSRRFEGVLLGTNWCVDSYGLFRADVLHRTRMFQPYYGAEKVLLGEVSLMGLYAEVPETLFFQRVHLNAASSLNSASQQHSYMSSAAGRNFTFTRLKLLQGHIGAALHIELSAAERARCFWVILKYLLQITKWRKILSKSLHGAGTGGENLRLLEMLDAGGQGPRKRAVQQRPGTPGRTTWKTELKIR